MTGMDKALHSHYLAAMGIQQWERRVALNESSESSLVSATVAEQTVRPELAVSAAAHPPAPASPQLDSRQLDWAGLSEEVRNCTRCPLHATRTQTVFGVGNRQADWMIVGEAPGADEDRLGEPFVGRGGQLLNAMLRAIGLPREQVYIANILKSRPPGNRDPLPEEVAACEPFLQRQIELVQPKIILAVGRIAAQNLLKTDTKIGQLRGHRHIYSPTGTPLVVTYHPAYLLRSPGEKRKAWEDLKFARNICRGEI